MTRIAWRFQVMLRTNFHCPQVYCRYLQIGVSHVVSKKVQFRQFSNQCSAIPRPLLGTSTFCIGSDAHRQTEGGLFAEFHQRLSAIWLFALICIFAGLDGWTSTFPIQARCCKQHMWIILFERTVVVFIYLSHGYNFRGRVDMRRL